MSKTDKQIIITAVLLVVLVVVVVNSLKRTTRRGERAVRQPLQLAEVVGVKPPSVAIPADREIIQLQKERAETLTWGRDPFQFLETDMRYRNGTLVLKGISLGRDKPGFAFINNEIVKVGEIVAGCEVLRIERDKVLLRKEDQSFYLTLPQE